MDPSSARSGARQGAAGRVEQQAALSRQVQRGAAAGQRRCAVERLAQRDHVGQVGQRAVDDGDVAKVFNVAAADFDFVGARRAAGFRCAQHDMLGADTERDLVARLHGIAIGRRTPTRPAASVATTPGIKFIFGVPRKPATNKLPGLLYSSNGVPTCSMRPPLKTTMRWPKVIASTWSCVT